MTGRPGGGPHQQWGADAVRLLLEDNTTVRLRAPTTLFGRGRAAYQRELHLMGNWWLEHRGTDWTPKVPSAQRS